MRRLGLTVLVVGVGLTAMGIEWMGRKEVMEVCMDMWRLVAPGGKLHPTVFLEHKGHLFIETFLLIAIVYLLFLPKTKPKQKQNLTEKEVEELCQEWQPEPLVPVEFNPESTPPDVIIQSRVDSSVTVNDKQMLNMGCTDFLGLLTNPDIQEACKRCIEKYGVGSCGPRGFYGTLDVHLKLEEHITRFMKAEEAIVYSFDIATISSVLPAFANTKDILVVDECVYYPIQNGCDLSRAQIRTFKHNNMDDLELVLIDIEQQHSKLRKPLNRRFIVVEGIYHDTGEVAKLREIYGLKCKYKYRLIVDESLSLGVLGETGRGVCEASGLEPEQIDIVTASMSHAMASVGGFCVGDHDIVGHQRLGGYGYVFSASLPAYLVVAADEALTQLEHLPVEMQKLRENAVFLRRALFDIKGLRLLGSTEKDMASPLLHLQLSNLSDNAEARRKLELLVTEIRERCDILMSVPQYTGLEWKIPKPSLRLVVTAKHTKEALLKVKDAIEQCLETCL